MGRDEPWMILSEGVYLGFTFCFSAISACNLSRIFLAIAVPSILVAVIVRDEVEKNALGAPRRVLRKAVRPSRLLGRSVVAARE